MMPPSLDDPVRGVDAHEALVADGPARGVVDDGEIVRIGGLGLGLDIGGEFGRRGEGTVEQIGPYALARRFAV